MAPSNLSDDSLFETTHISSTVPANDAPSFLLEHGVFYQADKEAGDLLAKLGREAFERKAAHEFNAALSKYPVSMIRNPTCSVPNAL